LILDVESHRVSEDYTDGRPSRRFCQICNIIQPYRTRHCRECKKCIAKYDHHCYWIGGCIGELNHRKFLLFLTLEIILCGWGCIISSSGTKIYPYEVIEKGEFVRYSSEYGAYIVVYFICFFFLFFVLLLALYHFYIVMTGQSTWEGIKSDQLNYVKCYPRGFTPFNFGIFRNLRLTLCHGNRLMYNHFVSLDNLKIMGASKHQFSKNLEKA